MKFRPLHLGCALLSLVSLVMAASAQAQFTELTKKIPMSANVAVFINAEKLMASPVAIKEDWASKRDKAFASGVSFLPPDAKHAVLAMELDLQTWVPQWESAVIDLNHNPDINQVVAMTGGAPDTIEGYPVVALPSDAYLVKFGPSTGSFMAPANRQAVARWLRQVKAKDDINVSGYLFEAFKFANDRGTPVIIALDLEDAVHEAEIRASLAQQTDFLKKYNLNVENVARTLSGLRGLTLGITFGDKAFGKVKVDFKDEVSMTPELAKAAMIHAFINHGVMLNEFEDWKAEVSGKSISLEGFMTASGMQRVSSLFSRPPSLQLPKSAGDVVPKTKEEQMRDASVNYFHQIEGLLKDLRQSKTGASSVGSYGVWMSKYANKIDQLSALYVDPDLLNYGAYVSDSLRNGYNAIRSGAAKSRIREVNTPMQYNYYTQTNTYGYTVRDGWFGGGVVPWGNTNTYAVPDQQAYNHAKSAARTEEFVQSGNQARDFMVNIDKATGDIRRAMTTKYNVAF